MAVHPQPFEPDRVDIFYLRTDMLDSLPWRRLELALTDDERTRAGRFWFARHRRQYTLAHVLLQCCLRSRTGRSYNQARFSRNGKPELDPPFGLPALRYNLSHTDKMVAVALAWGHDVGIDVEAIDLQRPCIELADRFFSREEATLIGEQAELSATRFFATWTVKEAVLKAVGVGLGAPLDCFTVGLDPLKLKFLTHDLPTSGWHLRQRRFPGHFLSVAIHAPALASEPSIHFTEVAIDRLFAQDPDPDRAGRCEAALAEA